MSYVSPDDMEGWHAPLVLPVRVAERLDRQARVTRGLTGRLSRAELRKQVVRAGIAKKLAAGIKRSVERKRLALVHKRGLNRDDNWNRRASDILKGRSSFMLKLKAAAARARQAALNRVLRNQYEGVRNQRLQRDMNYVHRAAGVYGLDIPTPIRHNIARMALPYALQSLPVWATATSRNYRC